MVRRGELLASALKATWYGAGEARSGVKTDAAGRFQLSPLGEERVVALTLTAGGEKHAITVVTRPPPDKDDKSGLLDTFHNHYYAKFVYVLRAKAEKTAAEETKKAGGKVEAPVLADLSRLDGAWVIESFDHAGKPVAEDVLKRLKDEPLVIMKGMAKTSTGIDFVFEATKTPFTMTGTSRDPAIDGVHGIWKVAGDVLTVCRTSRDRPLPDKFSSTTDNGWQLRVYRREKVDKTASARLKAVWGDLTLRFVYDGPRPKPGRIAVTTDAATFGPDVPDESLLVGDDGGLANVAVYLTSKDAPVHVDEQKRAEAPSELKVQDGLFRPRVLPLKVGQKLTLSNPSTVAMNFHFTSASNPFNFLVAAKGDRQLTLSGAERSPLPLRCDIHTWMRAYLLPLDHPYAAVSGKDGVARLRNLPAGDWTFRLWHEKAGYFKGADGKADFRFRIEPRGSRAEYHVTPKFELQAR
jgi:uncharacterized protein (TIGR03067 family)